MGRRLPHTPRSQIRSALRRQVWLRSRERTAAIKRAGNTCEMCGRKGSRAKGREVKIEVHHADGIEWEHILDYIYRHLLPHPDNLNVLCKECHAKLESEREGPRGD